MKPNFMKPDTNRHESINRMLRLFLPFCLGFLGQLQSNLQVLPDTIKQTEEMRLFRDVVNCRLTRLCQLQAYIWSVSLCRL